MALIQLIWNHPKMLYLQNSLGPRERERDLETSCPDDLVSHNSNSRASMAHIYLVAGTVLCLLLYEQIIRPSPCHKCLSNVQEHYTT